MRADSISPAFAEVETIDGRRLRVEITINPRARRISVRIDPVRRLAVATAPSARQLKRTHAFVVERAGWIAKELSALPQGLAFLPHAMAPFRGALHELIYEQGRGAGRCEAGRLIIPAPGLDLFEARAARFFKGAALADLKARVAVHAAALGVEPRRIQVKDTRSRWGSCSTEGALSFSWRVICAPPFVLDYLAAHEVAHLREMNHSRRFWALVKRLCPEDERGKAWLDRHGAALHGIGVRP
ncbi:MAG: M48 family metallopeptidase [Hyphomonadaceae bacterium]